MYFKLKFLVFVLVLKNICPKQESGGGGVGLLLVLSSYLAVHTAFCWSGPAKSGSYSLDGLGDKSCSHIRLSWGKPQALLWGLEMWSWSSRASSLASPDCWNQIVWKWKQMRLQEQQFIWAHHCLAACMHKQSNVRNKK